jgi:hypothetical protein
LTSANSEASSFELFKPLGSGNTIPDNPEAETMRRFAKDLTLALDVSTAESAKIFQNTVAKVCREYLG